MRAILLTTAAMIAFAANSLLTRGALGNGLIDAASFTIIRLVTGALTLALLARIRRTGEPERGAWTSALALAGYAVAFTLAYTRIGAAVGALLLFGAVQVTMIGVGLARGERPARIDWAGVALAVFGLLTLTLPGAASPDAIGAALMIVAGACWGGYSLAGRRSRNPLVATAGNFARASVIAIVALAPFLGTRHLTASGIALAAASGSIASGIGYTLWYAALPALLAWRAAVVQLVVPMLTALLAALMLGESITPRLVAASGLVAAGVWLTVWPARHRR